MRLRRDPRELGRWVPAGPRDLPAVLVLAEPGVMVTVLASPHIVIPPRNCGLQAGDRVLPGQRHPGRDLLAVLDQVIRPVGPFPRGERGDRECHDSCHGSAGGC
jgi:hypothetical protein